MTTISTNDRFDKLTNFDISTHYREREYWFMRSSVLASFAYWVVYQSPYDTPDITSALNAFGVYVAGEIEDGEVKRFTYDELREFINEDVFESIPEIEKLNHPKIDTGVRFNICTRYEKPKADYDFIDLDALARNVTFMLFRN